MPELPEVETTRTGIAPYVLGETINDVIIRERRLRWTVPVQLKSRLVGTKICKLSRRGKYLIFETDTGYMIMHLGMSGNLRILTGQTPPDKHDHVDFVFSTNLSLRFHDPRRFGCILWTEKDPLRHKLLADLGPEPLRDEFNGEYLFRKSRKRSQSVKTFIMDSHIVVGIGNIYANEALFAAGIRPNRKAGRITRDQYVKLVAAIKEVLQKALVMGGTTLRDFVNGEGKPGYFRHKLQVYDRANEPCFICNTLLKVQRIGQRSTFFCRQCQR